MSDATEVITTQETKKVQLSFLGRVPATQCGYVKTKYRFHGGSVIESAFFGFALADVVKPAELVVLGTTGSMWHALLDLAACNCSQLRQELADKSQRDRITQDDLALAVACLSRVLKPSVRLVLIPYGRDENEQIQILQIMADQVGERDEVVVDVTHGLRHLPMLGLLSALLVRVIKNARVSAIYYGALDLTDRNSNETPVLELSGLLAIAGWAEALARFHSDGDYGALACSLERAGLPKVVVEALRTASFLEQVCWFRRAREKLQTAKTALTALSGPAKLFQTVLQNEIDRAEIRKLADHQYALARAAWGRGDLLRAVTLLYEAVVTRALNPSQEAPDNFDHRRKAAEEIRLGKRLMGMEKPFTELCHLRNGLAHAQPEVDRNDVRGWLSSPETLQEKVNGLFDQLGQCVMASGRPAEGEQ